MPTTPALRVSRQPRALALEQCEPRMMLAGDALRAIQMVALDSNVDGRVSSQDVMALVRELAVNGNRSVDATAGLSRFDANRDRWVNVQDAIRVLTHVGQQGSIRLEVRELLQESVRDLDDAQRERLQEAFHHLNQRRHDADLSADDLVRMVQGLAQAGDPSYELPEITREYLLSAAGQQARDLVRNGAELGEVLKTLPVDRQQIPEIERSWQQIIRRTDAERLEKLYERLDDYLTKLAERRDGEHPPRPDRPGDLPDHDDRHDIATKIFEAWDQFVSEPLTSESMRQLLVNVQDIICHRDDVTAHHPLPYEREGDPRQVSPCDIEIPDPLPPNVEEALTEAHALWQRVKNAHDPIPADVYQRLLHRTARILTPVFADMYRDVRWDNLGDVLVTLPYDDISHEDCVVDLSELEPPTGSWEEWVDGVLTSSGTYDLSWLNVGGAAAVGPFTGNTTPQPVVWRYIGR